MPEIEIRPAKEEDIPSLTKIDHHYKSDHVWQMDFQNSCSDGQISIKFRQVRLPRSNIVEYPKPPKSLLDDWADRSGILVATYNKKIVGYISFILNYVPQTTWISDLAVDDFYRRKGIGTALVLAALEWAKQMKTRNLVLEMQLKNYPAIQLAQKLGFDFNGFCNFYYTNHDIGLFFRKSVY